MISKYIKILLFYNTLVKLKFFHISHIAVIIIYLCEALALYYCYIETDVKNFTLKFLTDNIITMTLAGFMIICLIIIYLLIRLIFQRDFKINNSFILENKLYHFVWLVGIYFAIIVLILTGIHIVNITTEGITWLIDTYM